MTQGELGAPPLCPDLDDRGLGAAWERLGALSTGPETEPVQPLSDGCWQNRKGVPLPFVPKTITLVFQRSGESGGPLLPSP